MAAPISIENTDLPDVLLVKTRVFHDDRGYFCEAYSREVWDAQGLNQVFVQDNLSCSNKGVLRGLHYQIHPQPQGKLVRCFHGAIYDVAVDIRRGSPTFLKWVGLELSEENGHALWIPPGFAHGFQALADHTLVQYKCTSFYAPACERSIVWNDPQLAIAWPLPPAQMAPKDTAAPPLDAAEYNFSYP